MLLMMTGVESFAQPQDEQHDPSSKMTLNDCMKYAIEHNTEVKKQDYTNSSYRQDEIAAIGKLTPSISGSSSVSQSYGRSIDPETNTYTTIGNLGNSYSLYAEMTVFAGFTNINTVRMNRMARLMGVEELQQQKDAVAISTMKAYFDAVYYSNCAKIAGEQLETSRATLTQSQKLKELGRKSGADVAQIEAQVAADELVLTQQENLLAVAILSLKEQMNYPIEEGLEIETDIYGDEATEEPTAKVRNLADAMDYALSNNPKMKASDYSLRQKEINYNIVRGKRLPNIYLAGGYSTNYYKSLADGAVYSPFRTQLRDNQGHYFGAGINIPIFDGLSKQTNVVKAKNSVRIARQDNKKIEQELRIEIAKTSLEQDGYEKEYNKATKKVESSSLANEASLEKFKQGLISPIEMQTTANNLLQAKAEQLNAGLQYIIRCKTMDYYCGLPLVK